MKYTRGMSVNAAGAYLWELRVKRRLSRNEVAAAIRAQTGEGTNYVQVMRIEKGQPTKTEVLDAFVDFVRGDVKKVMSLLRDPDATEEMGRSAAMEWFKQNGATPDEREAKRQQAIALIDDLLPDPEKIDRLLGYGERLREE